MSPSFMREIFETRKTKRAFGERYNINLKYQGQIKQRLVLRA